MEKEFIDLNTVLQKTAFEVRTKTENNSFTAIPVLPDVSGEN
jgi:hypothetical protein